MSFEKVAGSRSPDQPVEPESLEMMQPKRDKPFQLLLVEDNPADVRLIQEMLSDFRLPLEVSVAEDGEEAVLFLKRQEKYAEAARPDLVLLDLNLPRRDGHEVLQEIKESPELRQIPVVMLSSSTYMGDVRKAYDLHANCYIIKPVDLDDFFRVIDAVVTFWFKRVTLPVESSFGSDLP